MARFSIAEPRALAVPTTLVLAILLLAAVPGAAESLQYQRPLAMDAWWRLPGAHLVHWNALHAATNAAALLGLALCCGARCPGAGWFATCAVLCSALIHLGMPDIARYRGASTLVSLLLPTALARLWQLGPAGKAAAIAGVVAFATRAAADWAGLTCCSTLPPGVRSTWELHLAAFALGVLAGAAHRRRVSKPSS